MSEPAAASTEYLTTDQIAAELGVHPQTIQAQFRSGSLPGRRVGKGWRTTRTALDAWIAGHSPQPGHPHDWLGLETKDGSR